MTSRILIAFFNSILVAKNPGKPADLPPRPASIIRISNITKAKKSKHPCSSFETRCFFSPHRRRISKNKTARDITVENKRRGGLVDSVAELKKLIEEIKVGQEQHTGYVNDARLSEKTRAWHEGHVRALGWVAEKIESVINKEKQNVT